MPPGAGVFPTGSEAGAYRNAGRGPRRIPASLKKNCARTPMPPPSRRDVLLGTAFVLNGDAAAKAGVLRGELPWHPNAGSPPREVTQAGWLFFTADEAAAVEALADRIIPPDPTTPGGKDAGCAVFIDRQLIGSFGTSSGLYTRPPFVTGTPQTGPAIRGSAGRRYRKSLAALDRYCRAHGGKPFAQMPSDRQDQLLSGLEAAPCSWKEAMENRSSKCCSRTCRRDSSPTRSTAATGTCVSWQMIGFPGARYDYRDWVGGTTSAIPIRRSASWAAPEWNPNRT